MTKKNKKSIKERLDEDIMLYGNAYIDCPTNDKMQYAVKEIYFVDNNLIVETECGKTLIYTNAKLLTFEEQIRRLRLKVKSIN